MKTDDYIKNLSSDLLPNEGRGFYATTLVLWTLGTFVILVLSYVIFPARANLTEKSQSLMFDAETVLCMALFFIASLVAYRSSVPALLQSWEEPVAWGLLALLALMLIPHFYRDNLSAEFLGELNFYRGRCGLIILGMGVLQTALAMGLARRGAATHPIRTSAWIALSAGALGLFVMQIVCAHENFLHLVMWHAVPVGLLVAGGAALGRRVLKW